MRFLIIHGVIFAILFLTGCVSDAPRDNPLDPANGISISGKVERLYSTETIAGATIILTPGQISVLSNSAGEYRFEDLAPGPYQLVCSAPGFQNDTIAVDLQINQSLAPFKLNGLPELDDILIRTFSTFSFRYADTFGVTIEVAADDPDGLSDLQSVSLEIPALSFQDTLTAGGNGNFNGRFVLEDLGISSLQQLVNTPFFFNGEDISGARSGSAEKFISRILEDPPTGVTPVNDIVTPPFDIEWQYSGSNFSYTFDVAIYQYDFGPDPFIVALRDIPPTTNKVNYTGFLSDSLEYYWVVFVIDEFGNRVRSNDHPFLVR